MTIRFDIWLAFYRENVKDKSYTNTDAILAAKYLLSVAGSDIPLVYIAELKKFIQSSHRGT